MSLNDHSLVAILLEYGADPELRDARGQSALDVTRDDNVRRLLVDAIIQNKQKKKK